MENRGGNGRRKFNEIRSLILISLFSGRKTINQIATDINVNWKTVENHITYLVGKSLIKEVFSSEYVRIVEITPKGMENVSKLVQEKKNELIKYKKDDEKEVLFIDNN